ncbi:MAG: hypothetical protein ACXWNJ_12165 [Vulcanimicrobiaceae bacterium]
MTELDDRLLGVMRDAASKTLAAGEQFITPQSLLLALLDDPETGPPLRAVIVRERLEALDPAEIDLSGVSRLPDERLTADEPPALVRYDTLAFKTADGQQSVWLNKDALSIFAEGARRAGQSPFSPKDLALGFAVQAMRHPDVLLAMHVEPGVLVDAIYKL